MEDSAVRRGGPSYYARGDGRGGRVTGTRPTLPPEELRNWTRHEPAVHGLEHGQDRARIPAAAEARAHRPGERDAAWLGKGVLGALTGVPRQRRHAGTLETPSWLGLQGRASERGELPWTRALAPPPQRGTFWPVAECRSPNAQ